MDFNMVFMVPTGINCEIGGHAGDATKYLNMLAPLCDKVIIHPNVVNASDINEMPSNSIYVNGYILDQFLEGKVWLEPIRKPKILAMIEEGSSNSLTIALNTVHAAKVLLGADIDIGLFSPIGMEGYIQRNLPTGHINDEKLLIDNLNAKGYDCIAITSYIDVDEKLQKDYNRNPDKIPNPYGKVEAMLTDMVSKKFNCVSAHAPMAMPDDYYETDPRLSAEMISTGFFFSVLKGLMKAPLVHKEKPFKNGIHVKDMDVAVVPRGVKNKSWREASSNKVKFIEVNNKHSLVMHDNWNNYKDITVCNNYYEACGVLSCLKQGIRVGCTTDNSNIIRG